ncbi:MAG: glucokinase [Pseudomonadales bacterium]|nr:glucokinase [Pseudomonadales bacterium]
MTARCDRVSNERLISGPGVENLYVAISEVRGVDVHHRHASEIFEAALSGSDENAEEAVATFFQALGQVAGDFALSIGAFDGIYLAGGVVQRYGDLLARSRFREAFENKGRLGSRLRSTPTALITHPQPGLIGASSMAREIHSTLTAP